MYIFCAHTEPKLTSNELSIKELSELFPNHTEEEVREDLISMAKDELIVAIPTEKRQGRIVFKAFIFATEEEFEYTRLWLEDPFFEVQ